MPPHSSFCHFFSLLFFLSRTVILIFLSHSFSLYSLLLSQTRFLSLPRTFSTVSPLSLLFSHTLSRCLPHSFSHPSHTFSLLSHTHLLFSNLSHILLCLTFVVFLSLVAFSDSQPHVPSHIFFSSSLTHTHITPSSHSHDNVSLTHTLLLLSLTLSLSPPSTRCFSHSLLARAHSHCFSLTHACCL